MYKYVTDDYFVREEIAQSVDAKLPAIAEFAIDRGLNCMEADDLSEIVNNFFEDEMTLEELEFIIQHIQLFVAVKELIKDGLVEETEDGKFKITELGKEKNSEFK